MDFAAERARIREMKEYGVKTTRAWNRVIYWAAILSPIIYYQYSPR